MSTHFQLISGVIERFAKEQSGGVKVWDFGGSQTVMPIPNIETGSYLTSSMCILYLEGKNKATMEGKILPRVKPEVTDYGDGWKFFAVEFFPTTTPEELRGMLEKAKDKLLEGGKGDAHA